MLQTGLLYYVPTKLTTSLNANQTCARLPQRNFAARTCRARIHYALSPFLSFADLIKFDSRLSNLGLRSRFRWSLEPASAMVFILGHGWA